SVSVAVSRGLTSTSDTIDMQVVDVNVSDLGIAHYTVATGAIEVDESLPQDELNALTVDLYFGGSIAALRRLEDGRYLTSVNRPVPLAAFMNDPAFDPLLEWRVDDVAVGLGAGASPRFSTIGAHRIDFGPPDEAPAVDVETYRVRIAPMHDAEDAIPDGEPALYIAKTDPPGYEPFVTWLAATKYGSATPVLGDGPSFLTIFTDTFGWDPAVGLWQWAGVRADNAALGQDQKVCGVAAYDGGVHPLGLNVDFVLPVAVTLDDGAAAPVTIAAIGLDGDLIEGSDIDLAPGETVGVHFPEALDLVALTPNVPSAPAAILCGISTEILDASYVGECGDVAQRRYRGNASGVVIVKVAAKGADGTASDCPVEATVKNASGDIIEDLATPPGECMVMVHRAEPGTSYTVATDCSGLEGTCRVSVEATYAAASSTTEFTLIDKTFARPCSPSTWTEVIDTTANGTYFYDLENVGGDADCGVKFQIWDDSAQPPIDIVEEVLVAGDTISGNHQSTNGHRLQFRFECLGDGETCNFKIKVRYVPNTGDH
ncbi:MAG: hypothetical protein KDA25_00235, partial [Phycisphaerales bacterium]|nr:hypothetical protein [Phycisphaerales bacterium]